jgi:hypothetical protein
MAGPIVYEDGIGGTTGDDLVTLSNLRSTGDIWYVNYATGTDAAAPAGKDRIKPLKTTAQAITNMAAGDIVVWTAGHQEAPATAFTVTKAGSVFVSESTGTARALFTRGGAVTLFDVQADDVLVGNVYFAAGTVAATQSVIKTASAGTELRGLYFQCSTLDDGPAIELVTGAARVLLKNTTIISTAASSADQPGGCIKITNAVTRFDVENVVMDGGTSGWAQPYAFNGAAAVTRLRATKMDLLRGSDALLATGTTGWWNTRDRSAGAKVVWTP